MTRQKVGKYSADLLQKQPETKSPIEQMYENLTDYDKHIFTCIDDGKKRFDGDFFLVVLTKKEPLMPNVLRNYFIARISCPTPDYDQTVYKYTKADEIVDFLWVIPSKDTCFLLKKHALEVPESERELLNFVLRFSDGDLYRLCKKLNGEQADSNLLQE